MRVLGVTPRQDCFEVYFQPRGSLTRAGLFLFRPAPSDRRLGFGAGAAVRRQVRPVALSSRSRTVHSARLVFDAECERSEAISCKGGRLLGFARNDTGNFLGCIILI
jgi:hypothetical protein